MEIEAHHRTMLNDFITLFKGRADCYGSEQGGCIKEPLTRETFRKHLTDGPYIGVYPAVPRTPGPAVCVWGCSDIDIEDLDAARLIQRTLDMVGVVSWVERSRSKGYHVWVFALDMVPAEDMRRMLLVAHQVANYPAREVNPKQSNVSASKVGNYVRLPYPNALVNDPIRRVVLNEWDQPIKLEDWLPLALASRTDPAKITELAGLYVPPVQQHIVMDLGTTESLDDALRVANPMIRTIWRDGPLPNKDRSSTLMFLAYACQEAGMTPSMCHAVISDADRRWGKYTSKGQLEELDKIVSRAFGGR